MKVKFFLPIIFLFFSCINNKPYSPDFSTEKGKADFALKAWIQAQDFVKQNLKSPSTANFPFSDYSYSDPSQKDNSIIIKSYVDAQNSFGASIRRTFYIKLRYDGGEWEDINNWTLLQIELK